MRDVANALVNDAIDDKRYGDEEEKPNGRNRIAELHDI
jgi:hypothetical protein